MPFFKKYYYFEDKNIKKLLFFSHRGLIGSFLTFWGAWKREVWGRTRWVFSEFWAFGSFYFFCREWAFFLTRISFVDNGFYFRYEYLGIKVLKIKTNFFFNIILIILVEFILIIIVFFFFKAIKTLKFFQNFFFFL